MNILGIVLHEGYRAIVLRIVQRIVCAVTAVRQKLTQIELVVVYLVVLYSYMARLFSKHNRLEVLAGVCGKNASILVSTHKRGICGV